MPQSVRLYLVRHCDVANPRRVLYGHLPGFGLSEKGLGQAEALGGSLARQPIRVIRSSPLLRARQTATIISRHLGGVEVIPDDDLIEARFSLYLQGVPYGQVPWRRPLWWVHMVRPGLLRRDETVTAMADRVERSLQRVLDAITDGSGICISHGDPIQAFWIRHLGRPVWALHRLQCAKGGHLVVDYVDRRLSTIRYVPPLDPGAPASQAPFGGSAEA